jgi:hypothetical protein
MKTIKTKILATSLAALTCASFTVIPVREEELRLLSNKYAVTSDECFTKLMKNLKEIKAIIYIPDTKLVKGKELNMLPVETTKDTINLENYVRVNPLISTTDDCLQKAKITFDDLNMIVFVDKSYTDKLQKLNLVKLDIKWTEQKWKLENTKLKIGDKLKVLIDDTSAGYSQVEFKV